MGKAIVATLAFGAALLASCHVVSAEQDHGPSVRSLTRGCALAANPRQKSDKITDEDFKHLLDAMECVGLFAAIEQLNSMLPPKIHSCIPETITRGQEIRAFLAEATSLDKESLDGDAAVVIATILRITWPCSQK